MVGLNQNLVKIETSKAFTPLERQVLGMMHHLAYGESDAFYDKWMHSAKTSLGVFAPEARWRISLHCGLHETAY